MPASTARQLLNAAKAQAEERHAQATATAEEAEQVLAIIAEGLAELDALDHPAT